MPQPEPSEQPLIGPDGELLQPDTSQVDAAAYAEYALGNVHQVPRRDVLRRLRPLLIILALILLLMGAVAVFNISDTVLREFGSWLLCGLFCLGGGFWLFVLTQPFRAVLRWFRTPS
jgi:hypothetical protein